MGQPNCHYRITARNTQEGSLKKVQVLDPIESLGPTTMQVYLKLFIILPDI